MCVAWFDLASWTPRGRRVIQNKYFSLLPHAKQLLLVTFCNVTVGSRASFWTHTQTDKGKNRQTEGQTDVRVEMSI